MKLNITATLTKGVIKHSLFILLYLLIHANGFSQSNYSTDKNYLLKRLEKYGYLAPFRSAYHDTSIYRIHEFIPRNFLGNLGLSSPNYALKFNTSMLGFRLFNEPLEDYKIKDEDIAYYRTKGPFAELSGIAGSKQLQMFRMLFTHSFKKNFNVTMRLNRYSSQGYYLKQQSFTNNFYLSANYQTLNGRFGFNTFVLVNNNKSQENGGIKGDTLSEVNLLVAKNLAPVKLSNASRENKETKYKYSNWFRLNANNDAYLNSYVNFTSTFSTNKYKYKDQGISTDNYYLLYYLDTLKTNDSARIRSFINGADISLQTRKKEVAGMIGYNNEIIQLWQKSDTSFMNHIIKSRLNVNKVFRQKDSANFLEFTNLGTIHYIAAGNQEGNYKLESFHTLNIIKKNNLLGRVTLRLMTEERSPDYLFRRWYSNHFIWENTFNNTNTSQAEVGLKIAMFQITGTYKQIINYIYLDQLAYPMQYSGKINNTALKLNFDHVFFKHLGLSVDQSFQNSSSNLISLPKSISSASLFYTGFFFKKNLQLCIGGQVNYYDQFTPYAYNPALQSFYLQEKYTAGNFAFVDAFLNARIKPVNFFFKMENVLHGMLGTNYSMVPGYYQPERAIRFGLTWTFFD